jgi:hypothetical protein
VPVATAVIGDANHAAVIALLDMATKGHGAASLDGGHDAALRMREAVTLRDSECVAVAAKDVRHLQHGPHEPAQSGGITSTVS